jgi:NDP-sugar pyrophosphorylase family protein
MNIVIPAAGAGRRFVDAGYSIPKPFLPINGKPMVQIAIDNLADENDKVYLLMRSEHIVYAQNTDLTQRNNVCFVMIDQLTEGAACTVLRTKKFIDNDEPLLIANSDQYIEYDRTAWIDSTNKHDGVIMTFYSTDAKWSYAETDKSGRILRVAEKQVISPHATVGIYHYARGGMFVEAAERMISKNERVNGEFYVCPAYNNMVDEYDIRTFDIKNMYGLGTPEDFEMNKSKVRQ